MTTFYYRVFTPRDGKFRKLNRLADLSDVYSRSDLDNCNIALVTESHISYLNNNDVTELINTVFELQRINYLLQ